MRGLEGIFATALAALERFHETFVFFSHKLYLGRAALQRRPSYSAKAAQQRGPTGANKTPRLMVEKGRQSFCASSHFSRITGFELELAPALKSKLQPVAVASAGQSLSHSA
jgi:hypothetical protein